MGYGKRKLRSTVYGPRKQPRYITEQDLTVEDTRMTGERAVRIRDEVHGIVYIVDADADPDLDGVSMADRIRRLVILPDPGNPIPRAAPLTLLGTAAVRHMRGLPTALDRPLTRNGTIASGRGRPTMCPPPQVLAAHLEDGMSYEEIAGKYSVAKKTVENWTYAARKNYAWFPTKAAVRDVRRRRREED